ncbi:hypothetical protein L3Q82_006737 [Scortum barcoo]|uniref:Uncharacterized protein n=1 Tax=Scortum barcoo TaxID=214431 RepID=A0ACB8WYS8_9TELE|nr:hypothetical protein L3Q82_006737 [Scortum barcoo]
MVGSDLQSARRERGPEWSRGSWRTGRLRHEGEVPPTVRLPCLSVCLSVCPLCGDILQKGGSAVDGAIAALLCTSVINPQSMGIGGGSIFTVMDSSGKVKIINSRETVPRNFKPDLLETCPKTTQALTGEIRGYEQAHKLYGKLPWATLFQPTIQLAREGFPLPEIQGQSIVTMLTDESKPETKALRKLYSDENGNLLRTGDIVKFEKLADTLEMIANYGADAFYTGKIAEDLIRDIRDAGGTLTLQDLAAYKATVNGCVGFSFGRVPDVHTPTPCRRHHPQLHPERHESSLQKAKNFTEDSFADNIRNLISRNKTYDAQYYNVTPYLDNMGTTHVSVLAEDGSAVSVTSSINHVFGSMIFSPTTGVTLNDQLSDFCGIVNKISPGEQPPSSMAPAVLTSQTKTLVIGASGGGMITTGIASTLMNHLWFGKTLKEAINASVVFVDSKNALQFEPTFDKDVIEALKSLGHKQESVKYLYNVVNAVEKLSESNASSVWKVPQTYHHLQALFFTKNSGLAELLTSSPVTPPISSTSPTIAKAWTSQQLHTTESCTFIFTLLKFTNDTTLTGLSLVWMSLPAGGIDHQVTWCSQNNLELSTLKTVEMIVDFRKNTAPSTPISPSDCPVEIGESFRFLQIFITQDLRDILQKGGSAVDGAIAALLCTSVINPQSMGIGGGSIFTVMDSSGKVKIINSRETVPRNFKPDLLETCPKTTQALTEKYKCLKIDYMYIVLSCLPSHPSTHPSSPTIQLAREGFPLPEIQSRYVTFIDTNETKALRKLYLDENGNLLRTGDIVKFEKLADTLEMIANHGADAFYTGKIAEDLIRDIQDAGGTLTLQDLAAYKATVTDAWAFPLGEYQMYIPPPPAGGIILSFILNVMKGYDLNSASLTGEEKILTYHRYVETFKFANGLKKHIRDPHFSSEEMAKKFTEASFANNIRNLISRQKTHDAQYYNITPKLDSVGTTHVSVLAEDGSAVSVTSTINHIFGSKIFSPSTGIILNNELSDFCGRADNIFPGEQPPSSMAPAVLTSQTKTLVIGASGGGMITTGIASTLKEAIAAPVVYVDSKNALQFESTFDKDVIEALKSLGHKQDSAKYFYNVVNAVEKVDGCISAVSDARKRGKAAEMVRNSLVAVSGREVHNVGTDLPRASKGDWARGVRAKGRRK